MEDNNTPDIPTHCTAGCGFYGNKIYNNMCSKCFKQQAEQNKTELESVPKEELPSTITPDETPLPSEEPKESEPAAVAATIIVATEEKEEEKVPSKPEQKNKGRCFVCRGKIPLAKQVSNKCRCEYVFCDTHRYPDKHECGFDHASLDKDILARNNPKLNERPRGGRSFQRLDSV
ncbi:zinc finger domain-containing protein [Apophysomyces sp. BC1034]|nr:zinc finger domain-containing protein [Apophysomyces sp. BC1015]KAG0181092.1 zinc finger domain-containing protein [Apophysomyces sp. BC1021]KAG0188078.1 zinc finger domain-containing protein [Apophysomyces sp. BC1034]